MQYPLGIAIGLGLSVGGTILWRAIQQGLSVGYLICFSSTRLRYEAKALSCKMNLFFGEYDEFRPTTSWHKELYARVGEKHQHALLTLVRQNTNVGIENINVGSLQFYFITPLIIVILLR